MHGGQFNNKSRDRKGKSPNKLHDTFVEFVKLQMQNDLQSKLESKEKYKQSLNDLLVKYKENIKLELSLIMDLSLSVTKGEQQHENQGKLISILEDVQAKLLDPQLTSDQILDSFNKHIETLGALISELNPKKGKQLTPEDQESLKILKEIQSSINKIRNSIKYQVNVEAKLKEADILPVPKRRKQRVSSKDVERSQEYNERPPLTEAESLAALPQKIVTATKPKTDAASGIALSQLMPVPLEEHHTVTFQESSSPTIQGRRRRSTRR